MNRVITVTYGSASGVNDVDEFFNWYSKKLAERIEKFKRLIAERTYGYARANIKSYSMPYSKGELIASLKFDINGEIVNIYSDCEHAVFVEFGTGIVGDRNQHPKAGEVGYQYDTNNHGDDGWKYFNEQEGVVFWTKGMKSRPFMHNAYLRLLKDIQNIVREVF